MDYLEPPYQFFRITPELPIEIPVVRYQVGLASQPIYDPPGHRVVPTIRFHVPRGGAWGLQPYVDFGNRILIQRVLAIYGELIARSRRQVPFPSIPLLEAICPDVPRALTLRLIRHGERIDTWYDVEAVGV
jgi:hypothetical protein